MQPSYQVRLPAFTGPLDLLLHLIEQQELDITTISLAQVTDQYLAYIAAATDIAPDELADFLAIAARLLLIKSRALLPTPPQRIEEEEEVGDDLVRQLREYRRFKQVGQVLAQRDRDGLRAYPRGLPPLSWLNWESKPDLSGISLEELSEGLRALLREQAQSDDDFRIIPFAMTIDDKIAQIDELLSSREALTFSSLLDDETSKMEIIVTLLAVLEMIRYQRIIVRQENPFAEILILPAAQGPDHRPALTS